MNARCSTLAASSFETYVAVSALGTRIDFPTQLRGERTRAQWTTKVERSRRRIAQYGVQRFVDDTCRRREVVLVMPATEPVQQHRAREHERRWIRFVLRLNVGRGAVLRLRHAVMFAEVDRTRQTEAAGQLRRFVRQDVAEHIRRH